MTLFTFIMKAPPITICLNNNHPYHATRTVVKTTTRGDFVLSRGLGLSNFEFFNAIRNSTSDHDINKAMNLFTVLIQDKDYSENDMEWILDFSPELNFQEILFEDWQSFENTIGGENDCIIFMQI